MLRTMALMAASMATMVGMSTAANASNDTHELKPCVTEDQTTDCYWDAKTRGNGQGTSFVVVDGTVYLLK